MPHHVNKLCKIGRNASVRAVAVDYNFDKVILKWRLGSDKLEHSHNPVS